MLWEELPVRGHWNLLLAKLLPQVLENIRWVRSSILLASQVWTYPFETRWFNSGAQLLPRVRRQNDCRHEEQSRYMHLCILVYALFIFYSSHADASLGHHLDEWLNLNDLSILFKLGHQKWETQLVTFDSKITLLSLEIKLKFSQFFYFLIYFSFSLP